MTEQRTTRLFRPRKDQRIALRVTEQQKEDIEHAARLRGISVTDFIVASVQEATRETIRESRILTLTARDSELFAVALINPRQPSTTLQAAFNRHTEEVVSIDEPSLRGE